MKDRASRYLPLAVVFALLLCLPGLAAAANSTTATAPELSPVAAAPVAATSAVTVIDKADVILPNANHYKCYPILSSTFFEPRKVYLKDQFSSTWVEVIRPVYLCNPVQKTTPDGITYEPPQWDAHLVCYEIREEIPTPTWVVGTEDQFGTLKLKGNSAQLLCLPANKYVISPPGASGTTP